MDYGDRQERAEMLVAKFRAIGSKTINGWDGHVFTGDDLAIEIENMTSMGRDLVAIAGFVLHAITATPEVFEKSASRER